MHKFNGDAVLLLSEIANNSHVKYVHRVDTTVFKYNKSKHFAIQPVALPHV